MSMRHINADVAQKFYSELILLCVDEPHISIKSTPRPDTHSIVILVYDGKEHAYYTHAVFGQMDNVPVEQWTGNVSVTYATDDNGYYELIDKRHLPYPEYFDGTKQARIAIDAVKAHIMRGFRKPVNVVDYG